MSDHPQPETHTVSVTPDRPGDPESTWSWECSCLDEAAEFEDEEAAQDDADQHVLTFTSQQGKGVIAMAAGYLAKCGRKQRHADKAAAEAQRRAQVADGRGTMSNTNTYRCNQCGCWHVGSTVKRVNGTKGKRSRRNRRQGKAAR